MEGNLKNRNFVFYILLIWVIFTIVLTYLNWPLIKSNYDYYFNKKEVDNIVLDQKKNNGQESDLEKKKSEPIVLENKIIIPKINIEAPIVGSVTANEKDILKAMENGVTHYPGTSLPGQIGNVFLMGHSSNYRWAKGDYNHIFSLLNKVQNKDLIIIYYEGIKYTYEVNEVIVVPPTQTSVLDQTKNSIVSIMTCDPPGTTWKRRVVKAVQIDPNPNGNKPVGDNKDNENPGKLIGN